MAAKLIRGLLSGGGLGVKGGYGMRFTSAFTQQKLGMGLQNPNLIRRSFNSTLASKAGKSTTTTFFTRNSTSGAIPRTFLQSLRARFLHTTRASRQAGVSANPNAPEKSLSFGQRMKKLSREYGWSALGVYFMLSALDFPFCYLLVRWLGTDRIGHWEHIIVSNIKKFIPESVKIKWEEWRKSVHQAELNVHNSEEITDHVEMAGWGVQEAEERNKMDASLATQLALAYAIHKSFIFIRVPLTAAVTPKVVKILRGWGWDIGKRTTKAAKAAKRAQGGK